MMSIRKQILLFWLSALCWIGLPGRFGLLAQAPFTGEKTDWHGYDRYDFLLDEGSGAITPFKSPEDEKSGVRDPAKGSRRCIVIVPKKAAPGNPWSWRGCYWDYAPQTEIELLRRGFHVAYISASATIKPDKNWETWYSFLTEKHGLSAKPAFIGMSRGGEYAYMWATTHPDKVSCIYADNPGMNKETLMKFDRLAEADIPLLNVCGSLDPILGNNTLVIENLYQQLGGRISVMVKEGFLHHPHGLRDIAPIADWMEQNNKPVVNAPPAWVEQSAHIAGASGSSPGTAIRRSNYYGVANSYRYFPAEGAYITCRGPLFTETYDRYEFNIEGVAGAVVVTVPKQEAPGKPWVFRAGFGGRDAAVDLALLAKGFTIVTGPVSFNSDSLILKDWNTTYRLLTSHGFSKKPVMEGAGGAAGEVYGWAINNPDKVSCIYAENPLLRSTFSKAQPLDNLALLAKEGVPLLHACGSGDPGLAGNSGEVEKRYRQLGGRIRVIIQEGAAHYPLTPKDIGPVVDFITAQPRDATTAQPHGAAPTQPRGTAAAPAPDATTVPGGQFPAGQLLAGTAKVNLTPQSDEPLHDSIYARSLVLEVDGQRLAFVSVDLAVFTSDRVEKICKEKYGISQVMISSSHNHSEPQKGGRSFEKTNPYTLFYEDQILRAVDLALQHRFPARITAGHRSFPPLGFNRLIIRSDGHARESWFGDDHYTSENPERIPFGPVEPEVGVIRIDDMQGKPRVIFMNYACHADVVCFNYAISADYPGVAARKVEEAFGNTVNCLFVQGAGGNIEPLMISSRRTGPNDPFQTDYAPMERTGGLLAYETVQLAKSLQPSGNDRPENARAGNARAAVQFIDDSLSFTGRFDKTIHFNVHIVTMVIDSDIVIAACPGELFSPLQLDWNKKMGTASANPFLFGYTWSGGNWPGYVADIRSAALGGYGADQGRGLIEVGAGEAIINRQLENYYRLTGLMRDQPGPTGFKPGARWIITAVPPGK